MRSKSVNRIGARWITNNVDISCCQEQMYLMVYTIHFYGQLLGTIRNLCIISITTVRCVSNTGDVTESLTMRWNWPELKDVNIVDDCRNDRCTV